MFKKTLLALALTGLSVNALAENTTTVTASKISAQTLTIAKTATAPSVTVVLDDAYDAVLLNGAKMVITISGAVFNTGTTTSYLSNVAGIITFDDNDQVPVNAGSTLTYTLANKSGAVVDLDQIIIPTLPIILDTLTSTVTYAISFTTSGGSPVAGSVAAKTVATVADEWAVTYGHILNAEIDVAQANKKFVDGTTDTIKVDFTDNDTGSAVSSVSELTITLKGNFNGVTSVKDAAAVDYTINTAKTEASHSYTGLTGNTLVATKTLTVTVPTTAALVERTFEIDTSVKYGTGSTVFNIGTNGVAGAWKYNSSSTKMNFVPFGPNTQLIVNATSTFDTDASFDVTYIKADGTTKLLEDVGTVSKKSVSKLGDLISAAIKLDDGVTSGFTTVTVSVNAPDGKVSFFTGFKDKSDSTRMSLAQVDSSAADAKTAAEANKATLESTTKGLALTYDAVALNTTANNLSAVNSALAAANTLAAGVGSLLEATTSGNWSTGATVILDAICDTMDGNPAGSDYDVDTTATSGTPVADAAAVAGAVCVKQ
ncbi:MAG: hypothetical protein ACI9LM_000003 [Alteromonadaceae bacterium]|jgi:hypothetical protein